jgi:hypothetical protein
MIAGTDRCGDVYEDKVTHAQVFVTARTGRPYGRIIIDASCPDEAAAVRVLEHLPDSLDMRRISLAGVSATTEFAEAERRRIGRERARLERKLRAGVVPGRRRELSRRVAALRTDEAVLSGALHELKRGAELNFRSSPRWAFVRVPRVAVRQMPRTAMLSARIGIAGLLALLLCFCLALLSPRDNSARDRSPN